MGSSIFWKGNEYISASAASTKTGYSSDYIGQLCRGQKVKAKLLGRTWYVDYESLLKHKDNTKPGRRRGYSPKKISKKSVESIYQNAYRKSIKNLAITYHTEVGPILPTIFKKASEAKPGVALEIVKHAVALTLASIIVIGSIPSLLGYIHEPLGGFISEASQGVKGNLALVFREYSRVAESLDGAAYSKFSEERDFWMENYALLREEAFSQVGLTNKE